jgi:hypothetical protein
MYDHKDESIRDQDVEKHSNRRDEAVLDDSNLRRTNHSPEPWRNEPNFADDAPDERKLIKSGELVLAEVTHQDMEWDEYEANARRILDCVNGMKGIKDPYKLVLAATNVVIAYAGDVPKWIEPLINDLESALGLED